ncbi:MAG TPA: hypothetical protein VMZ91_07825 [Candidatus Paceibacterota bacterium]|nr:hypothetical protein [Candidatus Paceibacterota bacterium]
MSYLFGVCVGAFMSVGLFFIQNNILAEIFFIILVAIIGGVINLIISDKGGKEK